MPDAPTFFDSPSASLQPIVADRQLCVRVGGRTLRELQRCARWHDMPDDAQYMLRLVHIALAFAALQTKAHAFDLKLVRPRPSGRHRALPVLRMRKYSAAPAYRHGVWLDDIRIPALLPEPGRCFSDRDIVLSVIGWFIPIADDMARYGYGSIAAYCPRQKELFDLKGLQSGTHPPH